jgi:alkylation response protein AidB-like acyl-CoA dehydrogenase
LSILAGGPLFARNLAPDVFATMCGDPLGLVAGSLNPTARAQLVDGAYVFSGRAAYLSGSAHARWAMVGGIVFDGDEPVVTDGLLEIRTGAFPIDRARDLDTWHVTGMRATGSTDIEFEGIEIAKDWTFEPLRPRTPGGDDVFGWIPLQAQLGGGLAAIAVGAARNMIDRFTELAAVKVPGGGTFTTLSERAPAQIAVGRAEGLYQAARAVLHDAVGSVWARGVAHEPFDDVVLARMRAGVMTAVQRGAEAIDILHDVSGMNAITRDSVLDRCWRDVHTMTQHVLLAPPRFEIVGRVLLGLDAGAPVI